jgi:uncharacterized OB-fold protein
MTEEATQTPASATSADETRTVHPEKEYFAFLAEGRFMIQRSRSSGEYVFYPRVAEPRTGARDLEWVPASGEGTVHATTVVRRKPPEPAFNVALVQLAEGPRMMSRVEGVDAQDVRIGMAVKARIDTVDGKPLIVFDAVK